MIPSESFDWILNHIQSSYDSSADDPSLFDTISWAYHVPPTGQYIHDLENNKPRPPIKLSLNPAINDLTAATTSPKEFYFKSMEINWPIQARDPFNIELENYSALTGIVRMLFVGEFVMVDKVVSLS